MFTIGWNMPGYLPEMDPYECETADQAKRAMIDEILRSADHATDADDHDLADALSNEAEDLNLSDVSSGWDAMIGNIVYWITPNESEES